MRTVEFVPRCTSALPATLAYPSGRLAAAADFTRPPVSADTSVARPVMPRQSPRLGVTLISNNQSSRLVSGSRSGVTDSTSRPAMVSNSASFSGDALNVTNSLSQLKVNFMLTGCEILE